MEDNPYSNMNSTTAGADNSSNVENEWQCKHCSLKNDQSSTRCGHCSELKSTPSNTSVSRRSIISPVEDKDPKTVSSLRDQEKEPYSRLVETLKGNILSENINFSLQYNHFYSCSISRS